MLEIFKKYLKPKDKYSNVFIHIPKTGGSTFVGLLKESQNISVEEAKIPTHLTNSVGNTKILHVDFKKPQRAFKEPEIFNSSLNKSYLDKKIFLLFRNPIDRLLSEYNFQYHILDGKSNNPSAAILSKLKKIPHSFEHYIENPEVQDYQCKFLLGRKLADPKPVSESEFNALIENIEKLNIFCGLTEKYNLFLNVFSNQTNIDLNKTTIKRKQTPSSFKIKISKDLKVRIEKNNKYDYKLYKFISDRIVKQFGNTSLKKINIESSNKFIP